MADDTREETKTAASVPPKKNAKGVILDKDGKPCRTCNTLSQFRSGTKSISHLPSSSSFPTKSPSSTPSTDDCPPDVELLGRSSWTLLHSITATYPVAPSPTQQSDAKTFMSLFGKLYPCWVCAEDFQDFMARNRVRTESRQAFGEWMCEAHNEVNRKLGKREFDCSRWEERWRTGWRDGRCD
ncbi:FAD-dependent thiol oxidase [Glarea lozoyensis ATCC 20868]|uniref:Sulfhydryl oxidase n=1 Tax=Glarea lozoyensis (strain ATCC 20868 / MF5171) TaxID=1116229 RepID=S3E7R3_GLAL2|nr:FAD-dependent thiol oxidase [Glarea lozoyensis ATCC 20868]EPE34363.1 FAD-dependent thiol oxidase [Glarea lozoyensis ATCC 20868]